MTRHSAATQLARVLATVRANPDSTVNEIAPALGLSIESAACYLRTLERRGGVWARLETTAEAAHV